MKEVGWNEKSWFWPDWIGLKWRKQLISEAKHQKRTGGKAREKRI
jgi:hypothetical protein